MCIKALDDRSPCCDSPIERVYYRWPGVACAPEDADYSERLCVECGLKVEEVGDDE
jgi:hypothetical protein